MSELNSDDVRGASYGIGDFFAELNALQERVTRLENHHHRTDMDALRRFTTTPLTEDGKIYDSYSRGYRVGWDAAMNSLRKSLDARPDPYADTQIDDVGAAK